MDRYSRYVPHGQNGESLFWLGASTDCCSIYSLGPTPGFFCFLFFFVCVPVTGLVTQQQWCQGKQLAKCTTVGIAQQRNWTLHETDDRGFGLCTGLDTLDSVVCWTTETIDSLLVDGEKRFFFPFPLVCGEHRPCLYFLLLFNCLRSFSLFHSSSLNFHRMHKLFLFCCVCIVCQSRFISRLLFYFYFLFLLVVVCVWTCLLNFFSLLFTAHTLDPHVHTHTHTLSVSLTHCLEAHLRRHHTTATTITLAR